MKLPRPTHPYLKVHGRWCYLYRAIDRDGNLIDTMLSVIRGTLCGRDQQAQNQRSEHRHHACAEPDHVQGLFGPVGLRLHAMHHQADARREEHAGRDDQAGVEMAHASRTDATRRQLSGSGSAKDARCWRHKAIEFEERQPDHVGSQQRHTCNGAYLAAIALGCRAYLAASVSPTSSGGITRARVLRVVITIMDDEPERMQLRRRQEGLEGDADSSRQATA